jgi:hypothetical protein
MPFGRPIYNVQGCIRLIHNNIKRTPPLCRITNDGQGNQEEMQEACPECIGLVNVLFDAIDGEVDADHPENNDQGII